MISQKKIIYGKLYIPENELKTKKQIYPHLFRKLTKTKYSILEEQIKNYFPFTTSQEKGKNKKKKPRRISVQVHFIFSLKIARNNRQYK